MTEMERIDKAAKTIQERLGGADVGVILGSGLGAYADHLAGAEEIRYADIPGFPAATVKGHAGKLVFADLFGKRACFMSGRFHSYEGHPMADVVLPVRVMARLGVKTLIVTNAAGGVNIGFTPGDLMLITDFINLTGLNPLRGENLDEFGPRFPDMRNAYDPDLRALARRCAAARGVSLREGVYCWMNGPCYETPAEIRMIRILGADAVGMSTVPETIVARHCGMRVLGVSCITNMASGVLDQPITHQEVIQAGRQAEKVFSNLIYDVLQALE